LFGSERSGVSQPFVAFASQLPYPKPHVKPHVPAVHVGDALARAGHAPPQTLQWSGFVCRLTSQPSNAEPLQLPKPIVQAASEHIPLEQTLVALGALHTFPQLPQFMASFATTASHPSRLEPLQFAKPASHVPITHVPVEQFAIACGNEQALPHIPQLSGSPRTSVSQPSPAA
jgi:hypothetical protein